MASDSLELVNDINDDYVPYVRALRELFGLEKGTDTTDTGN